MAYCFVVPSKQQRRRVHNEWDSNFVRCFNERVFITKDDIKTNTRHVHNPDFENGIVKIQMNHDEKEAVQVFLIEDIDRDVEERELFFVESVLLEAEAQQKKRAKVSKYRSTPTLPQCFQFVDRQIRYHQ